MFKVNKFQLDERVNEKEKGKKRKTGKERESKTKRIRTLNFSFVLFYKKS